MTWLFGQLWFLMLIAFLIGSLLMLLVERLVLPHVDELEAATGTKSEGAL
jgi:hypothetical protein